MPYYWLESTVQGLQFAHAWTWSPVRFVTGLLMWCRIRTFCSVVKFDVMDRLAKTFSGMPILDLLGVLTMWNPRWNWRSHQISGSMWFASPVASWWLKESIEMVLSIPHPHDLVSWHALTRGSPLRPQMSWLVNSSLGGSQDGLSQWGSSRNLDTHSLIELLWTMTASVP